MKTTTNALPYVLPLVSLLGLACGTTPPEGSATGTDGGTGNVTTLGPTSDGAPTTGDGGTIIDSATDGPTQGSMSDGQTEATTGTTTAGITSTDPTTGTTTSP